MIILSFKIGRWADRVEDLTENGNWHFLLCIAFITVIILSFQIGRWANRVDPDQTALRASTLLVIWSASV